MSLNNKMLDEALNLPVSVNMRQPPVTISPSESVASIMYRLVREDIGAVLVEEEGRAVGIITEKDVLERVVSQGKNLLTTRARDIMSGPAISIEADRPIKQALAIMRKHNIRRLAVTQNEVLIGIVTERRLLAGILSKTI